MTPKSGVLVYFFTPLMVLSMATFDGLAAAPAAAEAEADHAHHHAPAEPGYRRSLHDIAVPHITLTRDDGTPVAFPAELADGKPVVLNFIYTTCTAVCPMLSHIFAGFQEKLGDEAKQLRMMSVSIDPEHDTPARLAAYAQRYQAGPQWRHYGGTVEASMQLQKAFGAYYGDKMNHRPVVFMRAAPGQPWVRLDGFATADDLVREYRRLLQPPA
ncbi:MAG TPA: SCO family protein [Thiobacillus sp.]|nr:MAG: hypothetical protein B7Y50_00325 [Hydrogenophilales bacterium 28-61-11]OYZ58451.1 MAG: hypothetical protein B7Y21_03020 [Hydrogenophilales bacterium 16-61-112]OZA51053.1 MAG: hypothetical protein B7X81_00435 [Hydrogenophilales bacterium 17-61-76]HQT31709.1 SCO family protein [Thiobacillus sp.]HQT69676.1 SCO family protein [Thiobacillus sp.]